MLKSNVPMAGRKGLPLQRLGRLCRFLDMTPAHCRAFFAAKCPARKQQQLQRKNGQASLAVFGLNFGHAPKTH